MARLGDGGEQRPATRESDMQETDPQKGQALFRPRSTVEQWRIFQAVVEYGGYAQAAEALCKSQSSLNHAVAKLQQSLGVALLEVRGRKAELTTAGEIFLKRSRQLLAQMEDLEGLAHNIARQWESQINLYVSALQPRERLYRVLARFQPRSRGCRINLHERIHCHVGALQPGDLMMTEHLPPDRGGVPLDEVLMLPVCAPHHPLAAGQAPLNDEQLAAHTQVSLHPPIHRSLDWSQESDTGWAVTHYTEALRLILQGLGYGWMPAHQVRTLIDEGKLVRLNPESGGERRLFTYLLTTDTSQLGPATELLLRLLRAEYQPPAP